ncbi:hypothetical protein [Alicyclobacillus fodiniaquatilis]|uniref:Uncharacterized protein n=1 Tax=Alicyclobacillus fodiniaquatilis TaxID=1661150 RepID=A0ABW4JNY4_9BACL
MKRYLLDLLSVGKMIVPGPEVFWMKHFQEDFPLNLWVGLIRGHGRTILVNTGCSLEWAKQYGMTEVREDGIVKQLEKLGVLPTDVTDVVVTPFQAYAISNLMAFEQATIHLSKKGWIDFHAPRWHKHPHDIRERCIPPEVLTYLVGTAWHRVRLLEEDDEICEGVHTFWTGAHHRSSVAVKIETNKGTAILSDAMFYVENVTERHPLGINESMEECLIAYERIAHTADIILPLYDPRSKSLYEQALLSN